VESSAKAREINLKLTGDPFLINKGFKTIELKIAIRNITENLFIL
jgi:hypothetical protein